MNADKKWIEGRVNKFTVGTLENNWNEERFDVNYIRQSRPLDSQYNTGYKTTYQSFTSNIQQNPFPPESAVRAAKNKVVGFPGHQPEMDSQYLKARLNTYETDHRINYLDPRLKMFPFSLQEMLSEELKLKQEKQQNQFGDNRRPYDIEPAPVVDINRIFGKGDPLPDLNTTFIPPTKPEREEPFNEEKAKQEFFKPELKLDHTPPILNKCAETTQAEKFVSENPSTNTQVLLSPHNEVRPFADGSIKSFDEQYLRPDPTPIATTNADQTFSSNKKTQKCVTWNEDKLVEMSKTPRYEN